MRAWIKGSCIAVVGVAFASGCVASREAEVTIEPSYSYLRDPSPLTGDIWPVQGDPFADRPADRLEPAPSGSSDFRWPHSQ